MAIAAGGIYSLAIKNTGALVSWGDEDEDPPDSTISPTVEKYVYDVYGNTTIKTPNGSTRTTSNYGNRFMFTGREYDTETGNYYYRARYYSPKLGRFLQTDPIRYLAGFNLYTYVRNNPIKWIDPWGLCPQQSNQPTVTINVGIGNSTTTISQPITNQTQADQVENNINLLNNAQGVEVGTYIGVIAAPFTGPVTGIVVGVGTDVGILIAIPSTNVHVGDTVVTEYQVVSIPGAPGGVYVFQHTSVVHNH